MNLVPEDPDSLLAPYGQEIQIKRGISLDNGYEQLISLGIFRTQDARSSESGDGSLKIDVVGFDRSVKIIEAKFLHPSQVAAGSDYLTTIKNTILAVDPAATFAFPDFSATTPLLSVQEQDDRWAFVRDMAAAIGMDLYLDGDGVYVLKTIPSLSAGAANAELVEGENGLLTSAVSDWTREGAHNGFIYTGENTSGAGDPPRGEAFDTDPSSPTYFYGPFGQVPAWEQSSFLTSDAMALQAAQGRLKKELGTSRSIDFGSIVNPALEPTDIALIRREKLKLNENHIIDSLSIPLEADSGMTGKTRAAVVP